MILIIELTAAQHFSTLYWVWNQTLRVQYWTTRGPGRACSHILRHNSAGNLANMVNSLSVLGISEVVVLSRVCFEGVGISGSSATRAMVSR